MNQAELRGTIAEKSEDMDELQARINQHEEKVSDFAASKGWSRDPKSAQYLRKLADELEPLLKQRVEMEKEIEALKARYTQISGRQI